MKNRKVEYYKGLDRMIEKGRIQRQMREMKRSAITAAKFIGGAVLIYGAIFIGWCSLCAMFPTWP